MQELKVLPIEGSGKKAREAVRKHQKKKAAAALNAKVRGKEPETEESPKTKMPTQEEQEQLDAELFVRATRRDTQKLSDVLDRGADVNASNHQGETPLMYASAAGLPETVTLLVNRGADVNAANNAGWSALKYASKAGHSMIVELLKCYGATE
jgi:ankyrin repeat protein